MRIRDQKKCLQVLASGKARKITVGHGEAVAGGEQGLSGYRERPTDADVTMRLVCELLPQNNVVRAPLLLCRYEPAFRQYVSCEPRSSEGSGRCIG